MLRQTKFNYTKEKFSKIKNLEITLEKKLQQLHPKKIDLSLERINKLLYKLDARIIFFSRKIQENYKKGKITGKNKK